MSASAAGTAAPTLRNLLATATPCARPSADRATIENVMPVTLTPLAEGGHPQDTLIHGRSGANDGPRMVYRYFYDCEFIEDGRIIDLVSIGVVDERGREFYAISTEFDDRAAVPWVRRNVLDRLPSPSDPAWRSRERIREEVLPLLVEPLYQGPEEAVGL